MTTALVVPTYQEAENIEPFLRAARQALPHATIYVCDDDSPDGTGDIAEQLGAELGNVNVVHRLKKEGLGAAYRHGFSVALNDGADIIIQMDVDFSHPHDMLAEMEQKILDGYDVAVGSRYIDGGATPDWSLFRQLLSKYGNKYAGFMLRLNMSDATSGLRSYNAETLTAIHYETTRANGYGFMIELAYRLRDYGSSVVQLPLVFHDRKFGESKMSVPIMVENLALVTWWGVCVRFPKFTKYVRTTRLWDAASDRMRPA